jgi:hypothetical protein
MILNFNRGKMMKSNAPQRSPAWTIQRFPRIRTKEALGIGMPFVGRYLAIGE